MSRTAALKQALAARAAQFAGFDSKSAALVSVTTGSILRLETSGLAGSDFIVDAAVTQAQLHNGFSLGAESKI